MKHQPDKPFMLSDFINNEKSQPMKVLAVLTNSALLLIVLAIFGLFYIDHEPTASLLSNIVGFSGIFVMIALIPLGLRFISRNEKRPVFHIVLKVVFFMFVIPLVLTLALFAIGWVFNWEGINPK